MVPGVKRQARQADYSPPISAEVKNTRIYTSASPYVFMAWCWTNWAQGQLDGGSALSQDRYLSRTTRKQKRRGKTSCLERDSNPGSQCLSGRRYLVPHSELAYENTRMCLTGGLYDSFLGCGIDFTDTERCRTNTDVTATHDPSVRVIGDNTAVSSTRRPPEFTAVLIPYSGEPGFKPQSGYWLFWQRIFVIVFSSFGQTSA
jgi:hypothetical protein